MRKSFFVLVLVLLAGLTVAMTSAQAASSVQSKLPAMSPIMIERASVLSPGELALDVGLAFEKGRELAGSEYDNLRLAPVGMRYGLTPALEVGGYFGFSANDQDDVGAPDNSGLEGISVFGKLEINKFAALQVGLTLGGDDDVFPYPSDGVNMFADLALQQPMVKGLLYGEFGYTVQGGDLDMNSYLNYGIGYAFPLSPTISLNAELAGEEAHVGTLANTLNLMLGANFILTDNFRLAPYVSLGLFDAGPDYAVGTSLELRF